MFHILLLLLLDVYVLMMKSIHVCFSPKYGRSDTTSYPDDTMALKQYGSDYSLYAV